MIQLLAQLFKVDKLSLAAQKGQRAYGMGSLKLSCRVQQSAKDARIWFMQYMEVKSSQVSSPTQLSGRGSN